VTLSSLRRAGDDTGGGAACFSGGDGAFGGPSFLCGGDGLRGVGLNVGSLGAGRCRCSWAM
jgi:hypothetical protein